MNLSTRLFRSRSALAGAALAAAAIFVCSLLPSVSAAQNAGNPDTPKFTSTGSMMLPANYREWVFLSSGVGMTYNNPVAGQPNNSPRFTNVFVAPSVYKAFQSTGAWPDNSVFVLEIRNSESKGSINLGGNYQGDVASVEIEVKKDGKWTFYDFGKKLEAKALPNTEACYTCHPQHGAVEQTFVQFYPTLQAVAKVKGTYKEKP